MPVTRKQGLAPAVAKGPVIHIAVVGSGAVGGYYGAKLAFSGQKVSFLARGAHLRAIRERGLIVWSPLGDFVVRAPAEEDPAAIGPVDLVMLAVKTYDNETALPMLKHLVGPSTVVVTLQNGVDSVGKRIELESLAGSVVRRGAAAGVPTPIMAGLYAVLKPWAGGRT